MINITDPIIATPTVYDKAKTPQSGSVSGTNFSDVLNGRIGGQLAQAAMSGMSGLTGMNSIPGVNMPPVSGGIEDTLIATAGAGEMSGEHLMLFILIMMMQSGSSGGDFAPIVQMLTQMLSSPTNDSAVREDDVSGMLSSMNTLDSNPGIRRMVDIALSQVGTREKNRDGTYGNGNITKYGAWYGMDGQPWCAMFVSWSADQAGILNDVVPKHASTNAGVNAYKAKGLYETQSSGYIPREGDAIYFCNKTTKRIQHVGIVVAYDPVSKKVYTVEGNTSNAVRIRHYDINDPRIHGYGKNGGVSFGTIPESSTSGSGANTI